MWYDPNQSFILLPKSSNIRRVLFELDINSFTLIQVIIDLRQSFKPITPSLKVKENSLHKNEQFTAKF